MEEILRNAYEVIINFVNSSSTLGPVFACLLILIESMLPILPLFVFITVIFLNYGVFWGFILSWIFTILGCVLSFITVRYISIKFVKSNQKKLNKLKNIINKLSLSQLVLIIAIPFTPAFLINIAAGLSNMSLKKFLVAVLIGKVSLVIFWGFIGTSLIESLLNPIILTKVAIMVLVAYFVSMFINKRFNIN